MKIKRHVTPPIMIQRIFRREFIASFRTLLIDLLCPLVGGASPLEGINSHSPTCHTVIISIVDIAIIRIIIIIYIMISKRTIIGGAYIPV